MKRILSVSAAVVLTWFSVGISTSETLSADPAGVEVEQPLESLLTPWAADLALGRNPEISIQMLRSAKRFSHIAKGFWLDHKCKILDPETKKKFSDNIAKSKPMIAVLFSREPKFTRSDGIRKTEYLIMYSYQEMEMMSFYNCGINAKKIGIIPLTQVRS